MFYDTRLFPFTEMLERKWKVIREELDGISRPEFETYRDFESWKVFILRKGLDPSDITEYPENQARCPRTMEIVDSIPGVTSVVFSRLVPGTRLWPHHCLGTDIRVHLGLVSVDKCALHVEGMKQTWHDGKCLAFNAKHIHEAWNRGDRARTVLLFDVLAETLDEPLEHYAMSKTMGEKFAGQLLRARYVTRKTADRAKGVLRKALGREEPSDESE